VERNPFESVPTHTKGNASRQRFISDEDARKVLDKLPSPEWRLLFALARWGGLRVPSEPAAMTWADVDWQDRRLVVHASKTEHHEGHESRVIPLFPEIAEPLQHVFEDAPAGQVYVLPFVRERTGTALRKPLMATIQRAGLTPWPRLWHNLRASRQTELVRQR
jgi:integrase